MPISYGQFELPHVLRMQVAQQQQEGQRRIPYRSVSYRYAQANLGRTIVIQGEIRELTASNVRGKIDFLRSFLDGVSRQLVLDQGQTMLNAILSDPEYAIIVGDWVTGRYNVPYSLTFLEI